MMAVVKTKIISGMKNYFSVLLDHFNGNLIDLCGSYPRFVTKFFQEITGT